MDVRAHGRKMPGAIKGMCLGPRHSRVPPVGLDERHIEPPSPSVGLGRLTTSSLRVTSQAGGAHPLPLVERCAENRSTRSSLSRRAQNPGQEGVGFLGAFRGNLVKKHRKII